MMCRQISTTVRCFTEMKASASTALQMKRFYPPLKETTFPLKQNARWENADIADASCLKEMLKPYFAIV